MGAGDSSVPQPIVVHDIQSDRVVITLEALRRVPSIANSVTQLLESYEEQARASLQGRQARKSGRYNTTDIVHTVPEYRWPNEGYHAPVGNKKVQYDDLILAQWTVGNFQYFLYERPDHSQTGTPSGHPGYEGHHIFTLANCQRSLANIYA